MSDVALTVLPERADLSIRFSPEQRRVILETCCSGASESEAAALLEIAQVRGLNPVLGECYFVRRYDSQKKREVWAVQASIDSLRIKAEQTGLYAGQDEPEYEYDPKGNVILARVRVWRRDWPRPAVGVARWAEYVQATRDGNPTRFWAQMPHNQLAKCAEALALRKAFPAVLSKLYTPEEMAQADNPEPAPANPLPVVPPRHPTPQASFQVDTFAHVCGLIDSAESVREVNAAAAVAGKAYKAGQLDDAQLERIKAATVAKRAMLAEPVPRAPESSPAEREPGSDDV
jgi:phage recombination protein Bet